MVNRSVEYNGGIYGGPKKLEKQVVLKYVLTWSARDVAPFYTRALLHSPAEQQQAGRGSIAGVDQLKENEKGGKGTH